MPPVSTLTTVSSPTAQSQSPPSIGRSHSRGPNEPNRFERRSRYNSRAAMRSRGPKRTMLAAKNHITTVSALMARRTPGRLPALSRTAAEQRAAKAQRGNLIRLRPFGPFKLLGCQWPFSALCRTNKLSGATKRHRACPTVAAEFWFGSIATRSSRHIVRHLHARCTRKTALHETVQRLGVARREFLLHDLRERSGLLDVCPFCEP